MMNNFMYTTGFGNGFILAWMIHVLAVILFSVGVLFLILWAVKKLTPAQLKTWGIGFVIGGAILCLLTIGATGRIWSGSMLGGYGSFPTMMQDFNGNYENRFSQGMMGSSNAGGLSMQGMSMMLSGKIGDAFDAAFIEGMIPHHQGAIDMAIAAKSAAKHDEIKTMADAIITAQQQEIDMMKRWQKDWGYSN